MMTLTSVVIVHDLDIACSIIRPYKADAISVVDPNAVLSSAIALEYFQTIAGWNTQVLQSHRVVDSVELVSGSAS